MCTKVCVWDVKKKPHVFLSRCFTESDCSSELAQGHNNKSSHCGTKNNKEDHTICSHMSSTTED